MTDTIAWVIALGFYAPFHYLGPLLVSFLSGNDTPVQRKRLVISILVDCTLSMLVAFALAIRLFDSDRQLAMLILVVSMCIPYLHIVVMRKYWTR